MTTAKRQFILTTTAILATAFPLTFAVAQSTDPLTSASRINSANALLRAGRLDEAIAEYQQITPSETQRDQLNYNTAVARYRAGDLDAAASLFADAAGSEDAGVAAMARYNLGNSFYAKALQTAEQDRPTAIRQLRTAIGHYRSSLRLEPNNADARANIELAVQLIRSLEVQHEQEQKEQQPDQQQPDQQQQQSPNDQQQESQQQQSDQQASDPSQSQDSESEDSESQQNQSGENEDSEDSERQQPSAEQQADDDSSDAEQSQSEDTRQPSEQQRQDAAQTSRDSQQPENTSGDPAAPQNDEENGTEPQNVPTGELTAADENNDDQQVNASAAMTDPKATDGLMTREEALKMLQAVRDRDMLRRLRQQQIERSRHIPVERDW